MSSEFVDVENVWKRDRSKRDEGNAPAGAVFILRGPDGDRGRAGEQISIDAASPTDQK